MTFNPQFTYEVLLPLSAAAYALPLSKGKMPDGYEQIAPIVVDGNKSEEVWKARKFINRYQHGWMYLNENERVMVVAYRGTDDFNDVVKDVCIEAEPYKCVVDYGHVHLGFQTVYFAIRDSVIATCLKYNGKYDRLILTGHSLGAAVSELSGPDLFRQCSVKPEIVNFAAPRVGKQDFADKFANDYINCIRIVNRWDTVPRVPSVWTGYRHVGDSITINGGFTVDALHAHSLDDSYRPGMEKLLT